MSRSIAVRKKVRGSAGKVACQVKTKGGKTFELEENIVLMIPKIAALTPQGKNCVVKMCKTAVESSLCPSNICVKDGSPKSKQDLPENNPSVPTFTVLQENPIIVSLERTRGDTFALLVRWCRHHLRDPLMEHYLAEHIQSKKIPSWDKKFFEKVGRPAIFDLMQNSSMLEIHYMTELLAQAVADQLKGKSAEQIREEFGIINDFTPEEEAAVKEDSKRLMQRAKRLAGIVDTDDEDPDSFFGRELTEKEEKALENALIPCFKNLATNN